MLTKIITISLPADLTEIMDAAANAEYTSRSNYIRRAVIQKLHADQAAKDEWQKILDRFGPKPQPEVTELPDNSIYKEAGFADFDEFLKHVDG